MQERVTELIGRIQDSDMMGMCGDEQLNYCHYFIVVGLLALNDSLNALFIRYDRHMKNRQAVLQGATEEQRESEQTTDMITMPTTSADAVVIISVHHVLGKSPW